MFPRTSPVIADWAEPCIVAATGPSLTPDVISYVRYVRIANNWRVLAVNDAYSVMPWADAMYACDNHWWLAEGRDVSKFAGELWTSHEWIDHPHEVHINDAREVVKKFPRVQLVQGQDGAEFSFDQQFIRYGNNSGFQAINLALLKGCRRIVLVGFDMRYVGGQAHYFGNHPKGMHQNTDEQYRKYIDKFAFAAQRLPKGVSIVNATPGSALTCFPMMSLEDACSCREEILRTYDLLHRYGSEPESGAG